MNYDTKREPVRHFLTGGKAACGRTVPGYTLTTDRAEVTCGRCLVTAAWRSAPASAATVVNTLALALNEWAVQEELCEQYDDAVDAINHTLEQFGLFWPERKKEWRIDLQSAYIDAKSEDEVFEKIAANPQDYIYIRLT